MRMGELAERAGVNVETVRYYERRGLLPEPPRTPNGHRRYGEDALRFLCAVKDAQALGFTLAEIEEHVRAGRQGPEAASADLRSRVDAKLRQVDERLDELVRARSELARIAVCSCAALDRCTCGAATLARGPNAPRAGTPLHVTNGDSTARTLEHTSLGGSTLSWRDVLHEGPAPLQPRPVFIATRAAFLASVGWGTQRSLGATFRARDEELLAALRSEQPVVLWFEHDLYDQLQLLDVLALVADAGAPFTTLELVQVGSYPGRPAFRGLGELSARELETLRPQRIAVTERLVTVAAATWEMVRSDDPQALARAAASRPQGLPFLAAALRRFLEELPEVRDGLSRTERQLLRVLADRPLSREQAFVASQELEHAPFQGDTWVFRALWELGRGKDPLVETATGAAVPEPPPSASGTVGASPELVLTEMGRRVLAGEVDRVELLGIDRWVGGTHLTPSSPWRWDEARQAPVARG